MNTRPATLLKAFLQARHTRALKRPGALIQRQTRLLRKTLAWATSHSPLYRDYRGARLDEFPVVDKAQLMAEFGRWNTVGVTYDEAFSLAERSEADRDFSPVLADGVAVGLSSGTSGFRGMFLVSPEEQAQWAGTILAKALYPIARRHRIALFLRANNSLYETLGGGPVQFRFFDLYASMSDNADALRTFDPTILVGPPSVLVHLFREMDVSLRSLRRLFSAAEVLDPSDEAFLRAHTGHRVDQIYQCTEGFLGISCPHGRLHLNEENLIIEEEWLDGDRSRFVPIVTDLYRRTQPIIRYRLNDVLTLSKNQRCACRFPGRIVDTIDGREDQVFRWPAASPAPSEPILLFPDFLRRAVLLSEATLDEYRIRRIGRTELTAEISPLTDENATALAAALQRTIESRGGIAPSVRFAAYRPPATGDKNLRIVEEWEKGRGPQS